MIVKRIYSLWQWDSVEETLKGEDWYRYKFDFQFNGEVDWIKKIFLVKVIFNQSCHVYKIESISDISGKIYYDSFHHFGESFNKWEFLQFVSDRLPIYWFVESSDNTKELLISFVKYIEDNHSDEYWQLCLFDESCEYGCSYEYAATEFLKQLNKKDPV